MDFSYDFDGYEFEYSVDNETIESDMAEMYVEYYFGEMEDKELAYKIALNIIENEGYSEYWLDSLKENYENEASYQFYHNTNSRDRW